PDLARCGLAVADRYGKSDPRGAVEVLELVAPLTKDAGALTKRRRQIWERIVKKEPNNAEAASQLALAYEAEGKADKCEKLLAPHRKRLGISEGARILGQLYARKGKLDDAHALLLPYAEGRMKKLHEAEQEFQSVHQRVWDQALNRLNPEPPSDFPLQR